MDSCSQYAQLVASTRIVSEGQVDILVGACAYSGGLDTEDLGASDADKAGRKALS